MAQCRPSVIAVNPRSITPCQRSLSLTCVQACPSPATPLTNSGMCSSNTLARGFQGQWPDYTKPAGQSVVIEPYVTSPIAGEGMPSLGLMPRRPCTPQRSGVPGPCRSSTGQSQNPSTFKFGLRHVEPSQPQKEQPDMPFSSFRNTLSSERQHEIAFRALLAGSENSVPAVLSPEKDAIPERTRLTLMAHESVQSVEASEKKVDTGMLPFASGVHQEYIEFCRAGSSIEIPLVQSLGSPGQQSVYPSDDGSTSEKHKHCSTIRSDESLTSDQLKAYRELEQAEMVCALKRTENCLAEERERSAGLQKMFATELMAQKDAHTRDVASLETMISKVLADNQRLSNMVEGLCDQVGHGKKPEKVPSGLWSPTPSSTCPSSKISRSKRSHDQSGSSEEGSASRLATKHNSAIPHRVLALNKDRMVNSSSPQLTSSEAEHTTDSELIPSSDDTSLPLKQVWTPKPKTYTCID